MYNPTDKSYLQACAIKRGGYQLDSEAQEIVDWISNRYQVKALDFTLEKVLTSMNYKLQRIGIILEREEECDRMEKQDRTEIVNQFLNYFRQQHSKKDKLKIEFFRTEDDTYPEIVFGFHALETIETQVAYEKATEEIRDLEKQFPDVWSFSQNWHYWTIFYYTDQQWKDNETNGTTQKIKDSILGILKKYDTFGLIDEKALKYVIFDSKQNLDENYSGNIYYYYK
jgi:hypothetical protein